MSASFPLLESANFPLLPHYLGRSSGSAKQDIKGTHACLHHQFHFTVDRGAV